MSNESSKVEADTKPKLKCVKSGSGRGMSSSGVALFPLHTKVENAAEVKPYEPSRSDMDSELKSIITSALMESQSRGTDGGKMADSKDGLKCNAAYKRKKSPKQGTDLAKAAVTPPNGMRSLPVSISLKTVTAEGLRTVSPESRPSLPISIPLSEVGRDSLRHKLNSKTVVKTEAVDSDSLEEYGKAQTVVDTCDKSAKQEAAPTARDHRRSSSSTESAQTTPEEDLDSSREALSLSGQKRKKAVNNLLSTTPVSDSAEGEPGLGGNSAVRTSGGKTDYKLVQPSLVSRASPTVVQKRTSLTQVSPGSRDSGGTVQITTNCYLTSGKPGADGQTPSSVTNPNSLGSSKRKIKRKRLAPVKSCEPETKKLALSSVSSEGREIRSSTPSVPTAPTHGSSVGCPSKAPARRNGCKSLVLLYLLIYFFLC